MSFGRDSCALEENMNYHSTPQSSYGHHLLRSFAENLNTSTCSSVSDIPQYMAPDRTLFEERIQKLEHEKKKTLEELNTVKEELIHCIEHNEKLQTMLDKSTKKLHE